MRKAEMYLIAAEAECRQGNEHFSKAKSFLKAPPCLTRYFSKDVSNFGEKEHVYKITDDISTPMIEK